MSEELFEVVDDHDRVTQVLTRSEVHRRKLLHRAIHVFVFRSSGEMLIHKRSPTKEEFPSVWTSSCAGHVSAGESYDDSAPRELFEELGLQASLKPVRKFSACAETSFEFTMLYHADSDQAIVPDPGEMTEIRWMHPDAINQWMQTTPADFSPAFQLLFQTTRQPVH